MKDTLQMYRVWNALRKHIAFIIIATVLASVAAFLYVTFFLTPLYESTLRLYPSLTISTSSIERHEPRLGSDREVRQHLEFMQSGAVIDSVVKKFSLIQRYEIDTTQRYWQHQLKRKANRRIQVSRTLHNSIEIAVKDRDPHVAAEMANYFRDASDNLKSWQFRQTYTMALDNARKSFNEQQEIVNNVEDSVHKLRNVKFDEDIQIKLSELEAARQRVEDLHDRIHSMRDQYGIFDLGEQINLLYEQKVAARAAYMRDSSRLMMLENTKDVADTALVNARVRHAGSSISFHDLRATLHKLISANDQYSRMVNRLAIEEVILEEAQKAYEGRRREYDRQASDFQMNNLYSLFSSEWGELDALRAQYLRARNNYRQSFIASYLVSPAEVNLRPVSPRRLLTTLITAVLTFFLAATGSIFMEARKVNR